MKVRKQTLNQARPWVNLTDLFTAGMDLTAYITTNYVQIPKAMNKPL